MLFGKCKNYFLNIFFNKTINLCSLANVRIKLIFFLNKLQTFAPWHFNQKNFAQLPNVRIKMSFFSN